VSNLSISGCSDVVYGNKWKDFVNRDQDRNCGEHIIWTQESGSMKNLREMHNKELDNLHFSQSIIRVDKSRTMKWA
jgi:hypothetical protein